MWCLNWIFQHQWRSKTTGRRLKLHIFGLNSEVWISLSALLCVIAVATSQTFRLLQLQETSEGKVFPSERVLEKLEELERGYSNEATARAKFSELLWFRESCASGFSLDFCSSTGDISWEACWKPCWCSKRGAALDTNHAVLLLGCAGILMDTHRNRWSGQQLCTFFCFYLINFPAGGCWYPFWTISCWVTHQAFQLPIRSTSQCKASRCKRPGVLSAARGICGVAMGSPLSNPLGTHVAFRKWATHVAFQMIAAFRDATLEQLLVAWPQTTEVLLDPVFSVTVSESEMPLLMLWPIWASDWGWNSAETAVAQGLGRDGHQTNGKTSRVWVWDCQVFSSR